MQEKNREINGKKRNQVVEERMRFNLLYPPHISCAFILHTVNENDDSKYSVDCCPHSTLVVTHALVLRHACL